MDTSSCIQYNPCVTNLQEENAMDEKTIQAIEAILRRGNDAKVRRKGGGYVVVEIKETIKLSPPAIVAGEGQ